MSAAVDACDLRLCRHHYHSVQQVTAALRVLYKQAAEQWYHVCSATGNMFFGMVAPFHLHCVDIVHTGPCAHLKQQSNCHFFRCRWHACQAASEREQEEYTRNFAARFAAAVARHCLAAAPAVHDRNAARLERAQAHHAGVLSASCWLL